MGFLEGLGRFIQGKPIFNVSQNAQKKDPWKDGNNQPSSGRTTPVLEQKVIPMAFIEQSDYHNSGSHTRITARIINKSDQQIELDKIRLLGISTELDTPLRPGESREFNVYEGNRPNHSNYDDAYLVYKNDSGDYFESHHTVEFRQENDDTYNVYRFSFVGPVKAI